MSNNKYFAKIEGISDQLQFLPVHGEIIVSKLTESLMDGGGLSNFPASEVRIKTVKTKQDSFYKFVIYTDSIQSYEKLLRIGFKI